MCKWPKLPLALLAPWPNIYIGAGLYMGATPHYLPASIYLFSNLRWGSSITIVSITRLQIRETVARSHLVLLDNKRLRGKPWNYWKRTRIDFLMHCSWQQKRTKNAWFSIFVCLLDGFWEANWWVRGRVRNHPVEVSCSFSFVAEDKEVVKFLPPMEATATTRMNKLQLHHIWLHPQTTSALQIPLRIHHMERW